MGQIWRRAWLVPISVALLVVGLMPGVAAAAGLPLVMTGQLFTAVGHLDKAQKLDVADLSNVAPAKHATVQLGRLVESKGAKGAKGLGSGFLVTVASTTTDVAGRYELAAKPDADALAFAAKNDGWVNFLVTVIADSISQTEGITRHWNGQGWDAQGRAEFAPTKPGRTYVTRDKQGAPLLGMAVDPSLDLQANTPAGPCSYDVLEVVNQPTKILEWHNFWIADANFEYGETADSDISLGTKIGNNAWSVGGVWHVGNSTGVVVGAGHMAPFDFVVTTMFEYEKIHVRATGSPRPPNCTERDVVYATRWLGGVTYLRGPPGLCASPPQNAYTTRYEQGAFFHRTQNRAFKFTGAVNLGYVSLDATSGYSTNMDVSWRASRDWMFLCGNDNFPPWAGIIYVW